jgi:hypothetical protein
MSIIDITENIRSAFPVVTDPAEISALIAAA